MKKMTVFMTLAILVASIVVGSVLATSFNYGREKVANESDVNGSNINRYEYKNTALTAALQAGDYDAYIAALNESDRPFMMQNLTEEQFNERIAQFKELETERNVTMQYQTEIQGAIQANDYNAWYTAETGLEKELSITSKVTADNFDIYVAMHEAIDSGNYTQARELAQEIGISEGIGGLGPNDLGNFNAHPNGNPNGLGNKDFNGTRNIGSIGMGLSRGHGR
jgi:hypothetical protein